jgi:hypothetical protein
LLIMFTLWKDSATASETASRSSVSGGIGSITGVYHLFTDLCKKSLTRRGVV